MRLITPLLVVALLLVTCVAFANGSSGATQPTKPTQPVQPTQPTQPEGAGPSEVIIVQPEQPVQPPSGAGPAVTTTTVCPPGAITIPAPPEGETAMSPEVEAFNTNMVVSSFNADRNTIMALRQAGWSWGDIYSMAQLANKTNQPLLAIATMRSQGQTYAQIAQCYNLSAMDLTVPACITTRVAGYTTEYNYTPIYYLTDIYGNPVLTRSDADRLSRLGYSWRDIAVASNIAAEAGVSVDEVLAWTQRGYTWHQIADYYQVDPDKVMVVSRYPFAPAGMVAQPGMVCPPVGAGPAVTCPVCGNQVQSCPQPSSMTTQPVMVQPSNTIIY